MSGNKAAHTVVQVAVVLCAAFALCSQFTLVVLQNLDDRSLLFFHLNNFFSFFTVLTNLLIVLVIVVPPLAPYSAASLFLSRFTVRSGVFANIALVGIVNAFLLRHLQTLHGLDWLNERLFHDVVPVLFGLYWLTLADREPIFARDVLKWTAYPGLYLVCILVRGALIGRYPYPFVNISELGYAVVLRNSTGMAICVLCVGLLVAALNRALIPRQIATGARAE